MRRKAQPLQILLFAIALTTGCTSRDPDRSGADATGPVKSLNSDTPALMTFVNQSGQSLEIYWIDFGGNRQLYKTLESGGSYTQRTYLTHPWLITDAGGQPWSVYLPEARPRTVYLQAPRNALIGQ
jgi:hypothetical protein